MLTQLLLFWGSGPRTWKAQKVSTKSLRNFCKQEPRVFWNYRVWLIAPCLERWRFSNCAVSVTEHWTGTTREQGIILAHSFWELQPIKARNAGGWGWGGGCCWGGRFFPWWGEPEEVVVHMVAAGSRERLSCVCVGTLKGPPIPSGPLQLPGPHFKGSMAFKTAQAGDCGGHISESHYNSRKARVSL